MRDMHWVERAGWLLGGAAGMGLFLTTRGFVPMSAAPALLGTGAVAVALVVGGGLAGDAHPRRTRNG